MTEEQVKHMVERFLAWKLPENFRPDGGITFKAEFNEDTAHPMKHEPRGTNLFDITQAEAMVRYIVAGLPPSTAQGPAPPSSTGARAVIREDRVEISFDVEALPLIVSGSCCCIGGIEGLWVVTDPAVFAREVCQALNEENEEGSNRIHRMFDQAFMYAIEQGAEGIVDATSEEFEAEAARLQGSAG